MLANFGLCSHYAVFCITPGNSSTAKNGARIVVDKRSLWQRKALKGSRLRLLIWGVLAAFLVVVKNLIMVLARKTVRARFHRHCRDIGHGLRASPLPWARLIRHHRRERRMGSDHNDIDP